MAGIELPALIIIGLFVQPRFTPLLVYLLSPYHLSQSTSSTDDKNYAGLV